MLENALSNRAVGAKQSLAIKTIVSVGLVLLAVVLPQIAHLAVGEKAGVLLLPMYLPVIIGGCVLGMRWAFFVGLAAPVVSFIITSLMGSPMPAAVRLPFMMAELAVFAVVSGFFSSKIVKNAAWSIAAVVFSAAAGRLTFLALVFLFQSVVPFTVPMIWGQIKAGFLGIALQLVIVPVVTFILKKLMCNTNE